MNAIVMIDDKAGVKDFLKALTTKTSVTLPNDEAPDALETELIDEYLFFIIENNKLYLETTQSLALLDFPEQQYKRYESMNIATVDILKGNIKFDIEAPEKPKVEVKDFIVETRDDKLGSVLIDFLSEFTTVKWSNGDDLMKSDGVGLGLIKKIEDIDTFVFIVDNGRLTWDDAVYKVELIAEDPSRLYYNSVADFLKDKENWIKK